MLLPTLIGVGAWVWLQIDLRHQRNHGRRMDALRNAGQWDELRRCSEAMFRTRRPFLLLNRLMTPGLAEARHAHELSQLGEDDEAVRLSTRAVQRSCGSAKRAALIIHCNALKRAHRLEESLEASHQLRALGDRSALYGIASTELALGRAEDAIRTAKGVLAADQGNTAAQVVICSALMFLGRFAEALAEIERYGEIANIANSSVSKLEEMGERERAERLRRRSRDVSGPGQFLLIAEIQVLRGDVKAALQAIDASAERLGKNLQVASIHHRVEALAAALAGDAARADSAIEKMWAVVRRHPRESRACLPPLDVGRALAMLGRFDAAADAFARAWANARSPVEKHVANFWIANLHQQAGYPEGAVQRYRAVLADGIISWFRARSSSALAGLKATPTPAPGIASPEG